MLYQSRKWRTSRSEVIHRWGEARLSRRHLPRAIPILLNRSSGRKTHDSVDRAGSDELRPTVRFVSNSILEEHRAIWGYRVNSIYSAGSKIEIEIEHEDEFELDKQRMQKSSQVSNIFTDL
jgi:hypothetical protein